MEYQPSYNRAGRFLTAEDISLMDRHIFMGAIVRCDEQGLCDENGVYYKNLSEPAYIIDGIEVHPRFYSEMDAHSGVSRHHVVKDCIESLTFNQLTAEERHKIRLQFQKQYVEEGGELTELSDDEEWTALNNDAAYDNVTIRYIETTDYMFADSKATRDYYIMHTLTIDDETPRILDEYSMNMVSFDNTSDSGMRGLSPEDIAVLDVMHEDVCSITTTDLSEVMQIMTSLGLVTWKEQKRFVGGV